jgi:dihydroorotate dehydrogenase electron transfer subunit
LNKLFRVLIKENKKLARNHYLITLSPEEKITTPKPGQFFMLSVDDGLDPLLKRPFSLHRWLGNDFQILYRVVGKATGILKRKMPGNTVEVTGPLGNGFPVKSRSAKMILVAGGLGIAPIFSLAETISSEKPLMFLGAKNKDEVLCVDELRLKGLDPVITTDDGSLGKKGLITSKVKQFLSDHSSLITDYSIYACGPKQMLKSLALLAEKFNTTAYIALEENMACGIGACLSCAVNTKKGFKRICKEGPVFKTEEIIW